LNHGIESNANIGKCTNSISALRPFAKHNIAPVHGDQRSVPMGFCNLEKNRQCRRGQTDADITIRRENPSDFQQMFDRAIRSRRISLGR
jgi:hypothetical protein